MYFGMFDPTIVVLIRYYICIVCSVKSKACVQQISQGRKQKRHNRTTGSKDDT